MLSHPLPVNAEHVPSLAGLWEVVCFGVYLCMAREVVDAAPCLGDLSPWGRPYVFQNDDSRPVPLCVAEDPPECPAGFSAVVEGLALVVQ